MKRNYLLIVAIALLPLLYSYHAYSQPELWGMTSTGGENGSGVIFKTFLLPHLNQEVVFNFKENKHGRYPSYVKHQTENYMGSQLEKIFLVLDSNTQGLTEIAKYFLLTIYIK